MAERNYTFREEKKIKDVEEVFVDNTKPLPIQTSVVETPATEIPTDGTNVTLVRQAFDKAKFKETVKTNFTELGVTEPDLSFFDPNLATVGDFFSIYNNLFYLIPKTGPNSHTTLIEDSSQYVDYKANQVEIQALLEEIAELREQNLQLTIDIGNVFAAQETIETAIAEAEEQANTD